MAKKKAEPEKKAEEAQDVPALAPTLPAPPIDPDFERRRRKSGAP